MCKTLASDLESVRSSDSTTAGSSLKRIFRSEQSDAGPSCRDDLPRPAFLSNDEIEADAGDGGAAGAGGTADSGGNDGAGGARTIIGIAGPSGGAGIAGSCTAD